VSYYITDLLSNTIVAGLSKYIPGNNLIHDG